MAHCCIPLLGHDSLNGIEASACDDSINRLQLIVAECHNVGEPADDQPPKPSNSFRAATVLVNLAGDARLHNAFRPLLHALSSCFTTIQNVRDRDIADALATRLHKCAIDFATVIVHVD